MGKFSDRHTHEYKHKHNQQTYDVAKSKSLNDSVLVVLTPTNTYPCTTLPPPIPEKHHPRRQNQKSAIKQR